MNILLIRLRLVGDVVFTTPAIRALRRRYPRASITYLVERAAAPVVEANPHLNEVLVVERRRGIARVLDDLRIARALRRRRFDVVIDFHGGPRASWLARATGAPVRIGYGVAGRGWMYTRAVERSRQLRARHSVESQWDLLSALGVEPPNATRDPVEMRVAANVRAAVERRLVDAGVRADDPLVVIHVSAGNPFRRWPEASFVELIGELVGADPTRRIVLSAGPSDAQAVARIERAAHERLGADRGRAIVRLGDLTLAELRALVERAALYIGGDSGPLHVAATSRVPIVAIFGPTLGARSMPWRDPVSPSEAIEPGPLACRPCDQRRCAPGDFRCLTQITAARVAAAAERVTDRACNPRTAGSVRIGQAPAAAPSEHASEARGGSLQPAPGVGPRRIERSGPRGN